MKRYTVQVDFYMYAESDEQVKQMAQEFADKRNAKYDCQANVMEIHETPFGKLTARKID